MTGPFGPILRLLGMGRTPMIGAAPADEIKAALIGWMSQQTPVHWHAVARQWHVEHGIEPLEWILSQPDCDRATAAMLFWRATPETILTCTTEREAARAGNLVGYRVAHMALAANPAQPRIGTPGLQNVADLTFHTRRFDEDRLRNG